jgi:preprotein translocase subunit YajC
MNTTFNLLATAGGGNWSFILIMVLMFVVMYFFTIRPQKKREKEEAAMRNSVDIGDKIITIGGISGVVITAKEGEEEIVIEPGVDKTRLRVKRWAIQTRIPLVVPTEEYDDDLDDDDDEE